MQNITDAQQVFMKPKKKKPSLETENRLILKVLQKGSHDLNNIGKP